MRALSTRNNEPEKASRPFDKDRDGFVIGEGSGMLPSSNAAPLESLVVEEDRRRLWRRAAGVLSEEQTTALWLCYVEDMPAREIARVLGRSWASVKVMLFRARKRLLPLLGNSPATGSQISRQRKWNLHRWACIRRGTSAAGRKPQGETRHGGGPIAVELEAPMFSEFHRQTSGCSASGFDARR